MQPEQSSGGRLLSFLSGIARALDLGGAVDNGGLADAKADARAMAADWEAVHDDIHTQNFTPP